VMKTKGLIHIKANGVYYKPQIPGVETDNLFGFYHVCTIKKKLFGRWQIDYYDEDYQFLYRGGYCVGDENKPNQKLILYPSGIEEIKYSL